MISLSLGVSVKKEGEKNEEGKTGEKMREQKKKGRENNN